MNQSILRLFKFLLYSIIIPHQNQITFFQKEFFMNTKNSNRNVSRTTAKFAASENYNYRATKIGAIKFRTASKAAVYLLKRSKFSQTEIARRCGVSQPCVAQLAAQLR